MDADIVLYDSVTANRSGRDSDEALYKIGQQVRSLEDIVNDGTYPHAAIGTLMIPKGSIGYVKSIGEFLQVIRVYEVHFLGGEPVEIVGCREHELEAMEEYIDPVDEEREIMEAHRKRMREQYPKK